MKKDSVGSVMADPSAFRTEVRMASVQVSGLTRREIEMALAYEVEPISLIPASEAQVDFNQIEGDDPAVVRYSVAVRRRTKGKTISGKRPVKTLVALGFLILAFIAVDAVVLSRSISSLESSLVPFLCATMSLQSLSYETFAPSIPSKVKLSFLR